MFGSSRVVELDGVSVTERGGVVSLTASRDLEAIATGRFAEPSCGLAWARSAWPDDVEFLGFAFTQFALPVVIGADLDVDFAPAPGLRSPRAVSPLIARRGGVVAMIAPIDHFHEQIVAVTDDAIVCGWHGDLDEVPSGFTTRFAIYEATSVAAVLDRWREDLRVGPGPNRPVDNPLSTHLSYWTDNGAAYWYRTEAGKTIAESVVDVVDELRRHDVPVRSVELDSWFYPHAVPRPIAEIGYPQEVPPTGMSTWSARVDAYPSAVDGADPLERFTERLGRPPVILHARHIAPTSPYVTDAGDWWIDEFAAHPIDPAFFRRWFDDAVRWGATVIEQDWMLMYWFGVRELRAVPGRAAEWQRGLNEHARDTGVDLLWCMATPADLMLAASLDRVIAVRTCDDYRFADDPAFLWTWFLTVNRLANALGLPAFKDCFFSRAEIGADDEEIDGDAHAELEALLAALSGGPVGIGDRVGRTDRRIVMRTCDDDGRIRRVDRAIAAVDRCLFGGPSRGEGLMWATTTATDVDGEVWTYLLAVNTDRERRVIEDRWSLGRTREIYEWRRGTGTVADEVRTVLEPRDWALFVIGRRPLPASAERSRYVVVESAVGASDV